MRRASARIGLLAAAHLWGATAHAEAARRIVSLDLCTDQLLIELADRARIAAVTHLAGDPSVSAIPEKARGLAVTRGGAEDVLRYDPDLVLAGPYGVAGSVAMLQRLGRRVVSVPQAADLDGVRAAVRLVATAIGEEAKGQAMIAGFDRRLARLPPVRGVPPGAIIYQVGGTVSATGSLIDKALAAAGYRNMAAEYRLTRGGQVPLEVLLARPPDLLVLSSGAEEYRTVLADNLRHPALALLRARHPALELPWRLWLCGTPAVAEAIERLAAVRVAVERRPR